jgi:hypothetical protein
MIITIKAQPGAGKSTAVKRFRDTLIKTDTIAHQPKIADIYGHIAILGDYDQYPKMSGCDGYNNNQQLNTVAKHLVKRGYVVIYESMMMSIATGINLEWHKDNIEQLVIQLECDDDQAHQQRQQRSTNTELKSKTGITSKQDIDQMCQRLTQQGVAVRKAQTVDEAVRILQENTHDSQSATITAQDKQQIRWDFDSSVSTQTERRKQKNTGLLGNFIQFDD